MTFPVELTLRTIDNEIRLCRNPIDGIKQLRYDSRVWKNTLVQPGENPLEQIDGDVFEIISEIEVGNAKEIVFDIRGEKVFYRIAKQELQLMDSKANVIVKDGKISLRFIIDRNSIEIYLNQGEVTFTRLFYPDQSNRNLSLISLGGSFRIRTMELYRLESIWLKREQELGYKRDRVE